MVAFMFAAENQSGALSFNYGKVTLTFGKLRGRPHEWKGGALGGGSGGGLRAGRWYWAAGLAVGSAAPARRIT